MSRAGIGRWHVLTRTLLATALLVPAAIISWADQASAQMYGGMPNTPECRDYMAYARGAGAMGSYGPLMQKYQACVNSGRSRPAPVQSAPRQTSCPDGTMRQPGRACAPAGSVACAGGSFCPQGTQCKPGGGCSLLESATMIGEEETAMEGLDRIKREIEAGNTYDADALQQQRERLLGPDIAWDTDTAAAPQAAGGAPQTDGGAVAAPGNPELARLNNALSAAKDDLTHIRDNLQRADAHQGTGTDTAVERARQDMQSSAALQELSNALPPAQQRLESMKRDMAQQNPASIPTTAGNAAAYPPAAQVSAADARAGPVPASQPAASGQQKANQGGASQPAARGPAPVQNTSQAAAVAQALMRNTPAAGASANATGDFAPPGAPPSSVVQDWLAGRPVDPAKLPPDAQREYWERQALLQIEAQADAIRREQAAEDAYQGMFGQAARDNAQAEAARTPSPMERLAAGMEARRPANESERREKEWAKEEARQAKASEPSLISRFWKWFGSFELDRRPALEPIER